MKNNLKIISYFNVIIVSEKFPKLLNNFKYLIKYEFNLMILFEEYVMRRHIILYIYIKKKLKQNLKHTTFFQLTKNAIKEHTTTYSNNTV